MNAQELTDLSARENRIVTEYPETAEEYDDLLAELLLSDGDVDTAERSGAGYSGPEARGVTEVWGEDWRVHLVRPPA